MRINWIASFRSPKLEALSRDQNVRNVNQLVTFRFSLEGGRRRLATVVIRRVMEAPNLIGWVRVRARFFLTYKQTWEIENPGGGKQLQHLHSRASKTRSSIFIMRWDQGLLFSRSAGKKFPKSKLYRLKFLCPLIDCYGIRFSFRFRSL